MMTTKVQKTLDSEPIKLLALPLEVEGVNGPDGHVPREILRDGTRIVIPYWILPEDNDELWITWSQNSMETRLYTVFYPSPLNVDFLYFDLTPQHMATDGIAFVSYKIWKGSGGNDDPSPQRKLTIDHTPPAVLKEPGFPHATIWGYLNKYTVPPLEQGATVQIPPFGNVALPRDISTVKWQGYPSLNGSGVAVPGTAGAWDKELTALEIQQGYRLVVPFAPYINPRVNPYSALVGYQLFRAGQLVAESETGLVKIDRVTPGEIGQFGLVEGEMHMTAQEKFPFKARAKAPKLFVQEMNGINAGPFASVIAIDVLADNSIPVSQLDTGKLIIKLNRPAPTEEEEGDEVDVFYQLAGNAAVQIATIVLPPIAERTDPLILEVDASELTELAQPAAPTLYNIQAVVYKGGAGNDDPSNVVSIVIDQTAPFEVKFPSRRKNPPTPAPTFVNAPVGAQRLVNEAFIAANAQLNFTVGVGYPLRRNDDELTVNLVSATVPAVSIEVFKGVVPSTGAFTFASSELRKLPNGRINITYSWKDLPGNISANSVPAAIMTLGLALDPVLREAPLVPKTDPNGTTTIYLEDLNGLVANVRRAFIDNVEPGDEIVLYVEDALDPTNFVDFGTQPLGTTDLTFALPYVDKLQEVFGAYTEAKEVRIWFDLVRGATSFSSPDFFFWLDLYPSGGIYPELPDLTNPNAVLPVITGASNTPNIIQPGDRDSAGKFTVTLKLTDPPITANETVKCYLSSEPDPVGEFSPFNDAVVIEVAISQAIINRLPIPTVQAYWTRQMSGIDKNIIRSPDQPVQVSGRKIDLLPPTVRVRNPDTKDQIDCFAMTNAASNWRLAVTIPKDPVNLPPGKVVQVHFAAYSDAAGTDLLGEDTQPFTIQAAGTADVASVGSGVLFKTIQPVLGSRAFGKYWYTADIGGQQTSLPIMKPLDVITSSGEYCDRTKAPAASR